MDREGTGQGYDVELTRQVSDSVSIPVIAHGGAGNVDHIKQIVMEGKADAVTFASILHYDIIKNIDNKFEAGKEGNIEFLSKGNGFSKVTPSNLKEIKNQLSKAGISCRIISSGDENQL